MLFHCLRMMESLLPDVIVTNTSTFTSFHCKTVKGYGKDQETPRCMDVYNKVPEQCVESTELTTFPPQLAILVCMRDNVKNHLIKSAQPLLLSGLCESCLQQK